MVVALYLLYREIKMDIEYLKAVAKESYNKIFKSATFLGICSENYFDDPICLIQLSIAILSNKPLFLLIAKGVKVPKKLIRILDGYEFYIEGDTKSFEEASVKLLLKIERQTNESE